MKYKYAVAYLFGQSFATSFLSGSHYYLWFLLCPVANFCSETIYLCQQQISFEFPRVIFALWRTEKFFFLCMFCETWRQLDAGNIFDILSWCKVL